MIRDKNTTFENTKKIAMDITQKKRINTRRDTCRAKTNFTTLTRGENENGRKTDENETTHAKMDFE